MLRVAPALMIVALLLARNASAQEKSGEDSAFAALQRRGQEVMGVDQYTSIHHFDPLPDGGRIALQRMAADSAGVARIRAHLRSITEAFSAGDFRMPGMVHDMKAVPGTEVMAARRTRIRYSYADLPGGGEVRITTSDPEAIRAVHQFLAFQRGDHRVGRDSGAAPDSSVQH